jgi:hypothetical protein
MLQMASPAAGRGCGAAAAAAVVFPYNEGRKDRHHQLTRRVDVPHRRVPVTHAGRAAAVAVRRGERTKTTI